jgi:hypothetical protein
VAICLLGVRADAELPGGNAIDGSRGDEERSKQAEYIGALSALARAGDVWSLE